MSLQKIEVEVDVPEGYTAIAYRKPQVGELYLDSIGDHVFKATASACNAIIVEKAVIVEKDPPKYREVRKGDEGRECEFKPSMSGEYKPARIVGFMSSGELIVEYENNGYRRSPNECRILDDGEPAKQPRESIPELKLGQLHTYEGKKYSLVEWRWDHERPDEHVGVFEVIDESAS